MCSYFIISIWLVPCGNIYRTAVDAAEVSLDQSAAVAAISPPLGAYYDRGGIVATVHASRVGRSANRCQFQRRAGIVKFQNDR